MGSRGRAEKVRTYNFRDDRITDHRLHKSVTCLEKFMNLENDFLTDFIVELNKTFLLEQLQDKIGLS